MPGGDLPGSGVKLTLDIRPKNDADFPLVQDGFLYGGFRAVVDVPARDAIPAEHRKLGMWVYVLSSGQTDTLLTGLANGDWELAVGPRGAGGDHATLSNLSWDDSGHLRTSGSDRFAGFAAGGVADGLTPAEAAALLSHATLSNLSWDDSGHVRTGASDRFAGFDASGDADGLTPTQTAGLLEHNDLDAPSLSWNTSGHSSGTGLPAVFAGFDSVGFGAPSLYLLGDGLDVEDQVGNSTIFVDPSPDIGIFESGASIQRSSSQLMNVAGPIDVVWDSSLENGSSDWTWNGSTTLTANFTGKAMVNMSIAYSETGGGGVTAGIMIWNFQRNGGSLTTFQRFGSITFAGDASTVPLSGGPIDVTAGDTFKVIVQKGGSSPSKDFNIRARRWSMWRVG